MTEEDRQVITAFFERLRSQQVQRDPQAEALIVQLMNQYPETRYVVTQMAFFQEHALAEAQNRIRQLEWEAQQKQGGVFGGLFGGNRAGPPPVPMHAPGYRPGMFNNRGSGGGGFLATAAMTAVGVVGGMMLGNAIMSALGGGGDAQAATADAAAGANPEPAADPGWDAAPLDDGETDFGGGFDDEFL